MFQSQIILDQGIVQWAAISVIGFALSWYVKNMIRMAKTMEVIADKLSIHEEKIEEVDEKIREVRELSQRLVQMHEAPESFGFGTENTNRSIEKLITLNEGNLQVLTEIRTVLGHHTRILEKIAINGERRE